MGSEWRKSTWGEEVSLEYGKAIRGYRDSSGRYQVFGSNGPVGRWNEALAQGPGVILGRKGAYRGVQFSAEPFWVIDTAYYVVPKSELDMRWLYYAIQHYKLGEIDDGSPIPSTTRAAVYVERLTVPSIEEQREIAAVLGALDDRIESLRQINHTLEAIAQAQFKSWFVDFDPVRAKVEGREPEGMDAATAALFPSGLEDSELGQIPKGWCVDGLGKISENIRDQAKPENLHPDTTYIGLEHMPRRSIALTESGTAEGLASGKFWYATNDILFGKLRPYFHKVGLAPGSGVCSTDILVVRPISQKWLGYTAMQFSSDAVVSYATQLSNGAKMPRTNWNDLAKYRVALPSEAIAETFNDIVRSLAERIHANIGAARTLADLRDTLLPRLISGEVRLPEAEISEEFWSW